MTSSHPPTRVCRSPFIRSSGACTGAGSSGCGASWRWPPGSAGLRASTEIRRLNHRYFNPQLKLPFERGGVEAPLRERLRQRLDRGHVTVSARWIEPPQREGGVALDLARARQLVAAAKELKKRLKLKGAVDLAFVARQPEVRTT